MVKKVQAELNIVAASDELQKSIAKELDIEDKDLEELLNNERNCPENNSKSLPQASS